MEYLVPPFAGIGSSPHHHNRIENRTNGHELRHDEDARARLAFANSLSKMFRHCPTVVRDQDKILARGTIQNFRIGDAGEFAVGGGCKINRRFMAADSNDDIVIGRVRLEFDQGWEFSILARAR